jgi:hypothetical protein
MRIRRWNGNLVITLPALDEPKASRTGKSVLVATSRGVRKSKLKFDGRSILYVANAFFYPTTEAKPVSGNAKKQGNKRAATSRTLRKSVSSNRRKKKQGEGSGWLLQNGAAQLTKSHR